MNSYFASVEQQLNPRLRGRPVAVVPMISDSTCAIAASHEAKKFGVKTGTNIGEARRMCPGLVLVEAKHAKYVEFHEAVKQEVERHYPIEVVASIDEMGLLLDRPRQQEAAAMDLARRIKAGLRAHVGQCITCSIGIAPNRYLAKLASDLRKPDGLTVLHLEDLPEALVGCKLTDLCGIGRRMEPRLRAAGILTVEDLWHATPEELRAVWGGVCGDRFWQELHGHDLGTFTQQSRSIGHSHVLAPEFRRPPQAIIVARRLLSKAASRLRRAGWRARAISLSVGTEERRYGEAGLRLPAHTQDTFSLMQALLALWPAALDQVRWARIKKIAVTLHDLQPVHAPEQLELFPDQRLPPAEKKARQERLSRIMDDLNQHYGRDSIALGFLPDEVKTFSGTKIAFTRIPDSAEFQE
jgi:DNA polymerase-4